MPRLGQVGKDDVHPYARAVYSMLFGDRDPVSQPGTATGTPGNWWTVMALVPDILVHFQAGSAMYRSEKRKLTPYFREFGQMRAGFVRGSQFVFSQHCKGARAVGMAKPSVALTCATAALKRRYWASVSSLWPRTGSRPSCQPPSTYRRSWGLWHKACSS